MPLPKLAQLQQWRLSENVAIAARYMVEVVDEHDDININELTSAPNESVSGCEHISVRYADEVPLACQVAGYYDPNPPTITMHRSMTAERDNFTILHEYAHYLQQQDRDWALGVLAQLSNFESDALQESVCDEFASIVLFPDDVVASKLGTVFDAQFLAELHRDSAASRSACCMRAIQVAPGVTECMVVSTDSSGTVHFARSNSNSLFAVPSGSVQEDFVRLFAMASANGGKAGGISQVGMRYSNGQTRNDLKIDLAIDHTGRYAFAVITPMYKFGTPAWERDERECNSGSCGDVFSWTGDLGICPRCGEPHCPKCSTCGCEKPISRTCVACFTELSVAESQSGLTTHIDCHG